MVGGVGGKLMMVSHRVKMIRTTPPQMREMETRPQRRTYIMNLILLNKMGTEDPTDGEWIVEFFERTPRQIIIRTEVSLQNQTHEWCPDCMNQRKVCIYHEEVISRKKFKKMRDLSPIRPRQGAIQHK
jgi:hypothetical protein